MSNIDKINKETNKMVEKVHKLKVLDGTKHCEKHLNEHKNCVGCISFEGCKKAFEYTFFAGEEPQKTDY